MSVETCRIEWRALQAVIDGEDSGRDPDVLPIEGMSVIFTPSVDKVVVSSPPQTIFLQPIVCTTNSDGYLVSPDNEVGVSLVASNASVNPTNFTYKVAIKGPPSTPSASVTTTFFATAGDTLDISTLVPVSPSGGETIADWVEQVNHALSAASEATTAAATAGLSADTAVQSAADAVAARDLAVPAAAAAVSARDVAVAARDATLAAVVITGAGRPDVAASMTVPVQALVAAATSGAEFRSLDGPQGAWVWRKRGTAWVCVEGDTGWVAVTTWTAEGVVSGSPTPGLTPAAGVAGGVYYRRIQNTVHLRIVGAKFEPTATSGQVAIPSRFSGGAAPWPYGLLPAGSASQVINYRAGSTVVYLNAVAGSPVGDGAYGAHTAWATINPWPLTLPPTI